MKRENEYEKTGYKKETGSEEYQKNGKKQNEYCEQNIVDQILQMSEDTEVLNRLKPENIAKLLENKKQKKHFRPYQIGLVAAACVEGCIME